MKFLADESVDKQIVVAIEKTFERPNIIMKIHLLGSAQIWCNLEVEL